MIILSHTKKNTADPKRVGLWAWLLKVLKNIPVIEMFFIIYEMQI